MRRYLRVIGRVALALLGTWLFACVALACVIHGTGTVDEAVRSDVVIVLGAALSKDGTPYKALTRRSRHAAHLWRQQLARAVICTGGVGDHVRTRRSEADGCREVLVREGVPPDAIVLENTSRSTEENALNSRTIMSEHGWRTAILVSDSYHVFRAGRLFRGVGIDVVRSPAPATDLGPAFYIPSVVREVAAIHYQLFKREQK